MLSNVTNNAQMEYMGSKSYNNPFYQIYIFQTLALKTGYINSN
jgi:hypothetical protein